MKYVLFGLLFASCIFEFISAQEDINYYIDCPIKKTHSYKTFKEAVEAAKKDGFEHNHFYICGNAPITSNLDLTYRAKIFGFDPKAETKNHSRSFSRNHTRIGRVGDPWTQEATVRWDTMHEYGDQIANDEVIANFIISPGVKIDFRGLTQLSKLGFKSSGSSGYTLTFHDTKNPIGIFNCAFGSFDDEVYSSITIAGTELKIYDSFVGANQLLLKPKTLIIGRSVFALGPGGSGSNPISIAATTSAEITSSYFKSDYGNEFTYEGVPTLISRGNNWFGTSVRFYGADKKLDISNEFGYTF